jgi:hypothetical protein
MTEKKALNIISHLKAEKYVNAIQSLQDEILELEARSGPPEGAVGSDRRKIKMLSSVIEKIGEAAMFGNEWEEGRRAQNYAIKRLQKMSEKRKSSAC